ncbi:MAG: hypothetical protein IPI73_12405 [Betaproteobacteria bacterium]|nr:hypothetical protein [Betaproteobacteria bacterium]
MRCGALGDAQFPQRRAGSSKKIRTVHRDLGRTLRSADDHLCAPRSAAHGRRWRALSIQTRGSAAAFAGLRDGVRDVVLQVEEYRNPCAGQAL